MEASRGIAGLSRRRRRGRRRRRRSRRRDHHPAGRHDLRDERRLSVGKAAQRRRYRQGQGHRRRCVHRRRAHGPTPQMIDFKQVTQHATDRPGRPRWCVTDAAAECVFLCICEPSRILTARRRRNCPLAVAVRRSRTVLTSITHATGSTPFATTANWWRSTALPGRSQTSGRSLARPTRRSSIQPPAAFTPLSASPA